MQRGVATSVTIGLALGLILAGWLLVQAGPGRSEEDRPLLEGAPAEDTVFGPPPDGDARAVIVDPQGDAVGTGGAAGDPTTEPACDPIAAACQPPPTPPTGGEAPPAPPGTPPADHVDIVEGGYEGETPTSLRFFVKLANIEAGFRALAGTDATDLVLHYELCWSAHDGQDCDRLVRLDVWMHAGRPTAQAVFELASPACGPRGLCAWPIASEVEFGAPATIRFDVPKAWARADGAWPAIAGLQASASWTGHTAGGLLGRLGIGLELGGLLAWDGDPTATARRVADTTTRHDSLLRYGSTAGLAASTVTSVGALGTRPGPGHPSDHPALDLRSLTLAADDHRLEITLRLGTTSSWPVEPVEHWIDLDTGAASWRIVHRHADGTGKVLLVPCDPACDVGRGTDLRFSYEGAALSVALPLSALALDAGAQTTRAEAVSLLIVGQDVRAAGAFAQTREWFDALPPAPPLWLETA